MNRNEFKKAVSMIKDKDIINMSLESIDCFYGCACEDFTTTNCTIKQVAKLIRYQCLYMNGDLDMNELNNIEYISKKKFKIIPEIY